MLACLFAGHALRRRLRRYDFTLCHFAAAAPRALRFAFAAMAMPYSAVAYNILMLERRKRFYGEARQRATQCSRRAARYFAAYIERRAQELFSRARRLRHERDD